MAEHFEYFDLSHCSFPGHFLIIRIFKFFYGYEDIVLYIPALQNNTVGPLSDRRQDLIFLHLLI